MPFDKTQDGDVVEVCTLWVVSSSNSCGSDPFIGRPPPTPACAAGRCHLTPSIAWRHVTSSRWRHQPDDVTVMTLRVSAGQDMRLNKPMTASKLLQRRTTDRLSPNGRWHIYSPSWIVQQLARQRPLITTRAHLYCHFQTCPLLQPIRDNALKISWWYLERFRSYRFDRQTNAGGSEV